MGKATIIRQAAAIVSCDEQDHLWTNCDILIEGPKIAEIAPHIEADQATVIDGRGKFVYPGLVNTHHHFFQTFVRNTLAVDYPNLTVLDWLRQIYQTFRLINEEVVYYASLVAMADLIKHGCTCAFDHQYCCTKATGKKTIDRQMDAASQLGLRFHAGRGTNTLPAQLGSTMPAEMVETTEEFLADCERLVSRYHDPSPYSMSQLVLAPCQPVNCYAHTFAGTVELARRHHLKMHTHLGEGENAAMEQRYGQRTLQWCSELGFIGPDVWIAHAWELQPQEYQLLASSGTAIAHCPAPAVLGGFPILDLLALDKLGLLVSLGCDGCATNDGSNLLDSLRLAYLMQAFHSKQRGGCPSPYDLLKMAAVNGAKTLGRTDIGYLAPNMAADLFMLDTTRLELVGATHDPRNMLARLGLSDQVYLTMINGKVVFRQGQLLGIDEEAMTGQAQTVFQHVLEQHSPIFAKGR